MTWHLSRLFLLFTSVAILSAQSVTYAQVVISDNIQPITGSPDGLFFPTTGRMVARQITVGDDSYSLTRVTFVGYALLMPLFDGSGNVVGLGGPYNTNAPTLRLFSDDGIGSGLPVNEISATTFTEPLNPLSIGEINYDVLSGGTLNANTRYWLVLGGEPQDGGTDFAGTAQSSGFGTGFTTGQAMNLNLAGWSVSGAPLLEMKVEATSAIPEPATTAWVMGLCILAACGVRFRLRSA